MPWMQLSDKRKRLDEARNRRLFIMDNLINYIRENRENISIGLAKLIRAALTISYSANYMRIYKPEVAEIAEESLLITVIVVGMCGRDRAFWSGSSAQTIERFTSLLVEVGENIGSIQNNSYTNEWRNHALNKRVAASRAILRSYRLLAESEAAVRNVQSQPAVLVISKEHYNAFGGFLLDQRASRFAHAENIVLCPVRDAPTITTCAIDTSTTSPILDLTNGLACDTKFPIARGGFADIWKCVWLSRSGKHQVAIKVMRPGAETADTREKIIKRFHREVKVWHRLDHKNVLPLYGLASDFGDYYGMVCPWAEGGNLHQHLTLLGGRPRNPFSILQDIAEGLSYLHSSSVVHGDLTPSNILMGRQGRAYLSDFGLSTIIAEFQGTSYFTSTVGGSIRWAASELYKVEDGYVPALTAECDIYSFASVMLQVLSGRIPFENLSTIEVLYELNKGNHPPRPTESEISEKNWRFMRRCWADYAIRIRPTAEHVLRYINNASMAEIPPDQGVVGFQSHLASSR